MMPGGPTNPLGQLLSQFGSDVIVTDPNTLAGVNVDHRKLYQGRALALALPRSTEEVAKLLSLCQNLRIAVVPQGGNTGYCAAATPDDSGSQLVLSLRRMQRIRRIEPANYSLVAEAGCVLYDVQQAALAAERFFPLSLGSEGSCTIGGNLSTNAGGLNVLRYGMTRELVLGLEVVLPGGRVLSNLSALRKDNTGYDLRQLFIGAEGTLGVITAASLKLFALPRVSATALVAVPTVHAAINLLDALRAGSADQINSFELLPQSALQLVARHLPEARLPLADTSPWYALCEITSTDRADPVQDRMERVLGDALECELVSDAVIAQNDRERSEFWYLRENIPEAQRRHGASLKHDVSIPIDQLAAFIDRAQAWLHANVPQALVVCYGHLGDGNLHFNLSAPEPQNVDSGKSLLAREDEIKRALHDLVQEFSGSFSAEHGIGRHKVAELERYADPLELELMHSIKRSFDPLGIMNPGKVLRSAP